jgi:hypothetical protein
MYPLVGELADDEIDVAVACRVLTVSRSAITVGLVGPLRYATRRMSTCSNRSHGFTPAPGKPMVRRGSTLN